LEGNSLKRLEKIVKKKPAPVVLARGLSCNLAAIQRNAGFGLTSQQVSLSVREDNRMVWHSSVIELLALRDGALTEKKSRRLKSHLEACLSCRSKASQIEENLRQSSSIAIRDDSVASRLDAAAKNLQRAIRTRRRSERADPGRARRSCGHDVDTRAQLAAELEAYLGPHLTAQLIREFDLGQEEDLVLFQKIGPTLTALLGQDASLEVATRLYRILVLDRRLASDSSLELPVQPSLSFGLSPT
jgi:hypothetical protein